MSGEISSRATRAPRNRSRIGRSQAVAFGTVIAPIVKNGVPTGTARSENPMQTMKAVVFRGVDDLRIEESRDRDQAQAKR
jgi:hypothetical protein